MKLTAQQLTECKNETDSTNWVYLKGKYWASCGTFGMSIYLRRKNDFERVGNCNDFRSKNLKEVNEILN